MHATSKAETQCNIKSVECMINQRSSPRGRKKGK